MARSQLSEDLVAELARREERRAFLEAINEGLDGCLRSSEETELLQGIRAKQRELLEREAEPQK